MKKADKQRLNRAEFLMHWFLEVFDGRKAPFPRKAFKGIAHHMREFLASGGQYREKYRNVPSSEHQLRRRHPPPEGTP